MDSGFSVYQKGFLNCLGSISTKKGNKVASNIEGKRRGDKAVLLLTISVPSSYQVISMVVERIQSKRYNFFD